jgi:hypothetical protein
MNSRDAARIQSFRRVVQCIKRHPELEAAVAGGSTWSSFQEIIAHVAELEVRQSYAEHRGKELTLLEERLKHAACDLVQKLPLLAELMELDGPRRRIFPSVNSDTCTADVILAARTCAKLALPHVDAFVCMGLAPTFIRDLEDAASTLEQVVADRVDAAASRAGATAAISPTVARGTKKLGILDSLIQKHMTPETLAEWKQAMRLGRTHRAPRATNAATPEAAPQEAASPAESVLEAGAEPAPPGELPTPAPLKALPPARLLEALIARLLRRADPRDRASVEQRDVTVDEIRRLPPPRAE